jgi:hypothetical protein
VHREKAAPGENTLQVEILDFRGNQWMELPGPRPAAQEIRTAAFQLSGTGSREDEAYPELINHRLDLIKQQRKLLYLIDDDRLRGSSSSQFLPKGSWSCRKTEKRLRMMKAVIERSGKTVLEQPSLAGLPRPEEEN